GAGDCVSHPVVERRQSATRRVRRGSEAICVGQCTASLGGSCGLFDVSRAPPGLGSAHPQGQRTVDTAAVRVEPDVNVGRCGPQRPPEGLYEKRRAQRQSARFRRRSGRRRDEQPIETGRWIADPPPPLPPLPPPPPPPPP